MARRRRPQRGGGGWWAVGALALAVILALWWFMPRRAEAPAPSASVPGARVLRESDEHITREDKQELERVLRERAPADEQ